MIGDPQVRNRGTIGGNIAHADPGSDLPTVLTALGATFHITGPGGERTIAASEFFTGLLETALMAGEIITAVRVPAEAPGTGSAYAKLSHPASRYAVVGAAAVVTADGGRCTAASVAVGGVTPHAVKAPSVEAALTANALNAGSIAAASEAVSADLGGEIMGDLFAGAAYRKAMAIVYVRRALTAASGRA
jgi:carbon-monoxide dehydrogenase medium subunit